MSVINLESALKSFEEFWSPRIVGQVNDVHIKLAKLQGEFVWHSHKQEDELFYVIHGQLVMHFRDRQETLRPGEMIVIPRGVEHKPVCAEETHVLLVEPVATVNTGDAGGDRTVAPVWVDGAGPGTV
ncbi:cupin domain-containing protein [Desulfovibrio inopinatus]|uniref:cupin domain-containing protein n=1 Tax=Desulfovibrio inopinatus TaxID=102109 RepID=UPI0004015690|nr:cupin domain-containing protein [Desulfovibrio inopinatus]